MGLTLFCAIALVAGTLAGPIQEVKIADKCARQCTVSNQFNYEAGTTYEFSYETELRTAIQGASEDHAGVHMEATAYLDFISKCEMVLRIADVKLMEHDPETSSMKPVTSDLIAQLERNPLTVSFQDGNVEELCLNKPETEEVLNIKRGLLSLIQNNMDDINQDQTVTETDVSGECEAEYSSSDKGWYTKLIKKSKNLLGCKGRQTSNIAVDSMSYDSDSNVQSVPLIKSKHECEQELSKDKGQLQRAMCQERHTFAPFSRLDSGAITLNTQTLTFVKEFSSKTKPVMITQRAPIQFQQDTENDKRMLMKDVEQKLMEICDNTQNGVTEITPQLFSSLVKIMKAMKSTDLTIVYENIKKNQICSSNNDRVKKFFLDAIPMCGSVDSVRYMVQLLSTGEVSGNQADMWMTTLSFIQNPTLGMLAEVKPLLSMSSNDRKTLLSVSSLIHRVCKNNMECQNALEVKKLITLMENKIASSCKISDDTLETSVLAIRAIGNAGFGEGAMSTLTKCIKRTENPIEIRLSAIQAFRRMSCNTDKSAIFDIFSNTEEDSEVRIAAYKTLMACPSDDLLSKVKDVLAGETTNQVGSYVWSHLTNLMETSDPHKQATKFILEDDSLKKEFDLDKMKFSRNYEKSLFIEKLNTGAMAEADLIWSSQSFIPRSGMLNLTVDLFGNAVNLFEVGGRIEGLEYFLESYFGPNGYFSEKDVNEAVDVTALELVKSKKVERIDKRNSRPMDDLKGSLYMRVFGNELRYCDFNGLDSLFAKNEINFVDILMKLSQQNEYQYTHSSMFMDSTMVVPTSSGFPLKLTVNGTATVDMKASGMVDVMKLASSTPTMDVHGTIKPSGAIVISSSMGIDAFGTQNGIKMVSTLYSSTSVQGKITLGKGSVLNVEFDLPEEKQDIVSVSSSFYTVHRYSEREQKMIIENRQEHMACTGDKIATVTGLEICSKVSFPNASLSENAPYFPMTGPVKAAIALYKRDKSMTGYKLEAKSIHDNDVNIVRVVFSTPGSNIDRSFGADVSLNKVDGTIDASFNTPWKRADFSGSFVTQKGSKSISGKLNYNGESLFDVSGSLISKSSGPGMIYIPNIQVTVPGKINYELTGSVKFASMIYLETEIKVNGFTQSPISLKASLNNKEKIRSASGSIELSPKQIYSIESSLLKTVYKKKTVYESQLSLQNPYAEVLLTKGSYTNVYNKMVEVDFILDKVVSKPVTFNNKLITKNFRRGRVQNIVRTDFRSGLAELKMVNKLDNRNWKTLAADCDITYVIRKLARDNIKLVTKLVDLSSKSLIKGKGSMNFASKRNPNTNFKILSNMNHNQKISEITADMWYGDNYKDDEKKVSTVVSLGRNIKSWSDASATLNGKLFVGKNFRIVSKIDHSHNPTTLNSNVMMRVNQDAVEATLTLNNKSDERQNLYGEFQLDYPGKTVVVSHLLEESIAHVYTSTLNVRLGKSKSSIVTTVNKTSPSQSAISSKIGIDTLPTLTVESHYTLGPEIYVLGGSVTKDTDKYSLETTAKLTPGQAFQLTTDLSYPTRRIIGNFEGSKSSGDRYSSRTDIRWNADRDDTQRVTINTYGQMLGMNNIDGSVTIQHPDRTVSAIFKNSIGSKLSTFASFKWEPNKIISFDMTLGQYDEKDSRQIIGSLKLRSPFQPAENIDVEVKHQISEVLFKTDIDVALSKDDAISGIITIRRPLTLQDIDIDIQTKAPSLGYKTLSASLQHHINTGMSTTGKVAMNRQNMQIDISLVNNGNDKKSAITGQVNFKSTLRNMRSASLKVAYGNDGRKLDGSALLDMGKQSFGLQTSMRNRLIGLQLTSNGELTITLPSDNIKTTWGHKNSDTEMSTTSETIWNKERVYINFNGIQDISYPKGKLSAALEIQTPLTTLNDIVFQLDHSHNLYRQIDSSMKMSSSGNELLAVQYKFLNQNNVLTSSLTATNPLYDGTVSMDLTSSYASSTKTAKLEMSLTPLQTITIDTSLNMEDTSSIDALMSISVPQNPVVTLTASRKQQSSYVDSFVAVEYQPNKVIRLDSTHRTGAVKQLKLKLTSPFTTVYETEGVFQKGDSSIRSSAMIVAEPFIRRWAIAGSADVSNGITGNFKLNTPYPEASFSEVTILSETVDGADQSSIKIEYLPGKVIQLSSIHQFASLGDLKLTLELTTPFGQLPYASMALRQQGDLQRFSNYAEVEYTKGKKIVVETKHAMNNGLQSSISISTPFTKDMMATVNYHGNMNDFESHGELKLVSTYSADLKHKLLSTGFESSSKLAIDESSIAGNIQFTLEPTITTKLSIDTPFRGFETIRISHSLQGSLKRFSSDAAVSVPVIGSYSVSINSDIDSTINVGMILQTPVNGYRNIKTGIKHQGQLSRFSSHVEFQNGPSEFIGDIAFTTNPALNIEAKVQTPYASLKVGRISMNVVGSLFNFKLNSEVQINKDLSEILLVSNVQKKYDIDLTIKSPYTNTIKASFDHWGSWNKFQSKFNYRNGKNRILSSVEFALNPTLNAILSIKSPFSWLKNHQLSLRHVGNTNSFKTNVEYKMNGKMYTGDASFQNMNSMKAELNIKGPTFKPIKMVVTHEGKPINFKSSATMSMGKDALQLDASMNAVNGVKGTLDIITPFDQLKNLNADISHSGDLSNFKCNCDLRYNGQSGQFGVAVDTTNDISATATLSTPFNGFEDMSTSLLHSGSAHNFDSVASYTQNGKSLESRLGFNSETSITGSASLKSDFESIGNYNGEFNIDGDLTKFSTSGQVNINNKKSSVNFDYDTTKGIEAKLGVKSPLMDETDLYFKHNSLDGAVNTLAYLAQNDQKLYNIQSLLSSEPNLGAIVSISTPHEGYESSEFSLHHEGTTTDFRSDAEIQLFGEKYECEVTLKSSPEKQVTISIKSPLSNDIDASVSFHGSYTNFNSDLMVFYGKESQIRTDVSLNVEGPISGDLKIISPYFRNIKSSFKHDGDTNDFSSEVHLIYAGQKADTTFTFKMSQDFEAALTFNSPFTSDIESKVILSGSLYNFKSNGYLQVDGQKFVNIDGNFHLLNSDVVASLEMTTILPNLEKMSASYKHSGDFSAFSCNAALNVNDNYGKVDLEYSPDNSELHISSSSMENIDATYSLSQNNGAIQLSAPYMQPLSASYNIKGDDIFSGDSDASVLYGSASLLSLTSEMNYPRNGKLTVQLPVPGYENTRLSYKRTGTYGGQGSLLLNGVEHEIGMSLDVKPRSYNAVAFIDSPMLHAMSSKIDVSGNPMADLTAQLEIIYNNAKHEIDVRCSMSPELKGSLNIKTPLMSELQITYETNKDVSNLVANGDISYDSRSIFSLKTTLENSQRKSVSVVVSIPENTMRLAANVDGVLSAFTSQAEVSYNDLACSTNVMFQLQPVDVSLTLNTPFAPEISTAFSLNNGGGHGEITINKQKSYVDFNGSLNPINMDVSAQILSKQYAASFSHDGPLTNFKTSSEMSVDNQKMAANMRFNMEGPIKGSFELTSPFAETLIVSFENNLSQGNLRSTMDVNYGDKIPFSYEINVSTSPLNGRVSIKTPIEGFKTITGSFTHNGQPLNFNTIVEVSKENQKSGLEMLFNVDSLNGRVTAYSPYFPQISSGFKFTGNTESFSAGSDVSVGNSKYSMDTMVALTNGLDATININTPVQGYKKITSQIKHNGQITNMDAFAQVMIGSRDMITTSIKANVQSGINVKAAFKSAFTPAIQVNLKHTGQLTNFNSFGQVLIDGTSYSTTVAFAMEPTLTGSLEVDLPEFLESSAKFDFKQVDDVVTASVEGTVGSEMIKFDGNLDNGRSKSVSISLVTPFEGLEKLQGSFNVNQVYSGLTTNVDMQYPGGRIQCESTTSWRQGITSSVSLKTPFESLTYSKVDFSFEGVFPNVATELNALYADEKYGVKAVLQNMQGKITITTPFSGFEDIGAEMTYQGQVTNLQTSAKIVYMTGEEMSASFQNSFTADKISTKVYIANPYTYDIDFDFLLTGELSDFSNSISLSMGEDNKLSSTTVFKLGQNKFDFDSSLQTVFTGYSDDQRVAITFSGTLPNFDASFNAKVLGEIYLINTNFNIDDSTTGQFVMRTPITNLRDINFNFEHSGSLRRFTTTSSLQYDSGKKIEASIKHSYEWRKMQTALEIQTPFEGFELSKIEYRHVASVDSFECNAEISLMDNDFSGNVNASMNPMKASITVNTPFEGFRKLGSDVSLNYASKFASFESNIQYMRDSTISLKSSFDIESNPHKIEVKLATPFQGYETLSLIATNTASLTDFQTEFSLTSSFVPSINAQTSMKYAAPMNIDGSLNFNSQIRYLESVSVHLKNVASRGKYQSSFESTWAPTQSIKFDSTLIDNSNSMEANIEFSSPFKFVKQLTLRSQLVLRGSIYTEKLTITHNGQTVADGDLTIDIGNVKSAKISIRQPTEIYAGIDGSKDYDKYSASITVSKDTANLANAFKVSGQYDTVARQLSLKHSCPSMNVDVDGTFKMWNNNLDLFIDGIHYGYKMDFNDDDGLFKVILPARSLLVKGTKFRSITEGSFMWDADRDETKTVGFRAVVRQSMADVTVMMPNIGKEVQIGSQFSMNSGRVIFDGKTEVVYSRDPSKKITMLAKLEDITESWSSKNYSFKFAVSHPYTSVDIEVHSALGKSADKITGGIDMKYLTANKDTKTFSVNGEVDKKLNSFSFNMDTPMKKININGNAKNVSPYQLILTNKYDNKLPLTTMATFDPSRKSASFQMNYDIDNPSNVFHLSAKYVNSSAVAAEMYHVVNRQKISDALVALRLNTSTLLHSRVLWRPTMLNDLKAFYMKKSLGYPRGIQNKVRVTLAALDEELSQKGRLITKSILQELKPVTDKYVEMYNTNEYHVRDVSDYISNVLQKAASSIEQMSEQGEELVAALAENVQLRLSNKIEEYRQHIQIVADQASEQSRQMGNVYRHYSDYVYNMSVPIAKMANDKYDKYMNQIDTENVAQVYTSAVYGAREAMHNGLQVLRSNRVFQHGENAYKYWEIRENVEMIAQEVADWIVEEIEKEISDIKSTILNSIKSKITVMDLENGEIQAEMHLPIPLKSLDVVPNVDFTPYMSKVQKYVPKMPSVSSMVIPSFEGVAKVQGNTVTTFDGVTYDLESSCTYLLARDNTDYNFTVVLHKNENNNTLVVMADGKIFNIYSNGMISINGQMMELPVVMKDTIVTSLDGRLNVNIAGHLTVELDTNEDLFVVRINAFYFGKTAGLLGSYDNEPSNDLMTSFGKPTHSLDRFAKTWDVGTENCK